MSCTNHFSFTLQLNWILLCFVLIGPNSCTIRNTFQEGSDSDAQTGDIVRLNRRWVKRDDFNSNWFNQYIEEQNRVQEEANLRNSANRYKNLNQKRGWTSTDTAIVIGIFAFCFGITVIKVCCCRGKSTPLSTDPTQTFIFNGIRASTQQNQPMRAFTLNSAYTPAALGPPPQYGDDDPPPDYFTATNTLLSTNNNLPPNGPQIR